MAASDGTPGEAGRAVVRAAQLTDRARIADLLEAAGLPTADLPEDPQRFLVAEVAGTVQGAVGLEPYPPHGLLRSLVVDAGHRGDGLAARLCRQLIEQAKAAGVERLYLLTTDGAAYFRRHGFREIPRDEAPPAIRDTGEFRGLCPGSATLMVAAL